MRNNCILPDWPAPSHVRCLQTTRLGGCSLPPYDSLNLGGHVGDDDACVERNRYLLRQCLPNEPVWLEQIHGTEVVMAELASGQPKADACVARVKNAVCAVMTADCLPVLLCDKRGTVVAAAHAGWRGLANGVLEATVRSMHVLPTDLIAWLGPAIGPTAFEVGSEVRDIFVRHQATATHAFSPVAKKYLADLYLLARQRLNAMGVSHVFGGEFCTSCQHEQFFSYRRDGATGRMATMIWLV